MINIEMGIEQRSQNMHNKKQLTNKNRSTATNRNAKHLNTTLKMIKNRSKRTAYRMRVVNRENKTLKSKLEIFEKAMITCEALMGEKVELLEQLVEEQNMWVKSQSYYTQTVEDQNLKLRLENFERKRNEKALKKKIKYLQLAIAQNGRKPNIKISADTAN